MEIPPAPFFKGGDIKPAEKRHIIPDMAGRPEKKGYRHIFPGIGPTQISL
jgi:hypothetical protein